MTDPIRPSRKRPLSTDTPPWSPGDVVQFIGYGVRRYTIRRVDADGMVELVGQPGWWSPARFVRALPAPNEEGVEEYTAVECAQRLRHLANHAVKGAEWIHTPLSKLYRRAADLLENEEKKPLVRALPGKEG